MSTNTGERNRSARAKHPTANAASVPIVCCAAIGAALLAISIYVWVKWLLSDDFRPVDPGKDPIGNLELYALRGLEVLGLSLTVFLIWRFGIKPWRANGRITGDGLILLAAPFVWFWDPFFNYTQTVFSYNAYLFNFGSWSSQMPTWVSPDQDKFPEPIAVGLSYIFWVFGFMVVGGMLFNRIRRRFPAMSTATFVVVGYLVCVVLNTVGEIVGMLIGWFAYPGVWGAFSMFEDTRYKFSLFSPLFGGLQLFLWVGLRYFRDDRGLTLVERGVETLKVSQRSKTVLRFLAIYTGLTAAVLAVNLGFNLQALHSSKFNEATPSYLTTTCPEKDTHPETCGGPGIPIPRNDRP